RKDRKDRKDRKRPLLRPRVSQVESASAEVSVLFDRTNLTRVGQVDAGSAGHAYYPGRIFDNAMGRFLVVSRATGATREVAEGVVARGDIIVEPFLGDEISSPRCRLRLRLLDEAVFQGDPVLIGRRPLAVARRRIQMANEHIATFRLGPEFHEIRQRIMTEAPARAATAGDTLTTEALLIIPNPTPPEEEADNGYRLKLGQARLVAAVMRAVLPSMVRNADRSIAVGLNLEGESPDFGHVLSPNEGFVLYDL
ncbi:unnamed protein product, partial [marine sediment metagenome]